MSTGTSLSAALPNGLGAWDAVVVGAGPAGAMAALGLARTGARVLLVDRAAFPRWKVCGCCLNRRAVAALEVEGVWPSIAALAPRPHPHLRLACGDAEARVHLPACMVLSRERLDAALISAAVGAGAVFVSGARARLLDRRGADGTHDLELASPGDERPVGVRARVLVAADGLGGALAATRLGGEVLRRHSRIGAGVVLDRGVTVDWQDDAVNMAVGNSGYVGIVRLEDGRWNLAAALDADAVRREGTLAAVVAGILRQTGWRVPRGLHAAPWRGTPALWRRPRHVAAERVFAVGDAAGYVEPFTGEGMAWALAAGRAVAPLAARAIDRWDPSLAKAWTRTVRDEVQRGQRTSRLAAWTLRRPMIAGALIALLASQPRLAAPAIARLNAV